MIGLSIKLSKIWLVWVRVYSSLKVPILSCTAKTALLSTYFYSDKNPASLYQLGDSKIYSNIIFS